jgi:hypothetical protein
MEQWNVIFLRNHDLQKIADFDSPDWGMVLSTLFNVKNSI